MQVQRLLSVLLFAVTLSRCTTTAPESEKAVTAPAPVTKAGTKSPEGPIDNDKLFRYFTRMSDRRMPYTQADTDYLAKFTRKPQSGSLEEAVVTVSIVRSVLVKADSSHSFEEQDIYNRQPTPNAPAMGGVAAPVKPASLEDSIKSKEINLTEALENNPYLKSFEIYQLVDEALKKTQNTPEFQEKVAALLKSEASRWSAIAPNGAQAAVPPVTTPPTDAVAPAVVPPVTTPPTTVASLPPSPAEIKASDVALMEAQKLAEQGLYKLAIKKASTVSNTDPLFPTAKEKIKTFSNRAVQALRQKAAEAFQNAMPVSDPATKVSYLEQARGYLQEAINNFPEADSLPTVQENLAVISRDLDRLNANKGAGGQAQ